MKQPLVLYALSLFYCLELPSKNLNSVLLIIPMVLLFIGVYGGLMQTLFRAGIVQSDPFVGGDYYKGLTFHGVLNAIVFTTFFAVALGKCNYTLLSEETAQLQNCLGLWNNDAWRIGYLPSIY